MSSRFSPSSLLRVMVCAVVSTVMLPAVMGGGRAHAAPLTPEQKQEMREHYDKAMRAYDTQKFGDAIEEYQKTYEIGGDPAMLFNVAQAYRLNGQSTDAVFYYRRYLERSPNAANRADVEQKIAALEETLEAARKPAASAPPPAAPPPPEALPAPVPAASAVVPPAVSPVFPPAQVVAMPPEGARDANAKKRIAGLVLVSVGAVGLITAAITGKLAENKGDNLTYASMIKGTFDPNVQSSGKTLDNVAVVSVLLGAGAAVAGGVLLVLSRRPAGEQAPRLAASRSTGVAPILGNRTLGVAAGLSF